MSEAIQTIRDQLDWLTTSLRRLRARVREAVAGELSRLISQSVEEVLQLLLKPQPRPFAPQHDADDAWDAEDELNPRSAPKPPSPRPTSWWHWLLTTGRIVVQVAAQSPRPWWPVGLAVGASVAALSPTPFWRSLWDVVITTAQLLNS